MNPLVVDLGKLSTPITKLVSVVAQGCGAVYEPVGITRKAKASAKAQLISTKAAIEKKELLARADARLDFIKIQQQRNIEAIFEKAKRVMPDRVSDDTVDRDFITHFFSAAQDVSESDMQELWARLLAGEVSAPGRFSRKTLDFLKSFSRRDALRFSDFLKYVFFQGIPKEAKDGYVSLFFYANILPESLGISVVNIERLEDAGLIKKSVFYISSKYLNESIIFGVSGMYKVFLSGVRDMSNTSIFPSREDDQDVYVLTTIGLELAGLAKIEGSVEIFNAVRERIEKEGGTLQRIESSA